MEAVFTEKRENESPTTTHLHSAPIICRAMLRCMTVQAIQDESDFVVVITKK